MDRHNVLYTFIVQWDAFLLQGAIMPSECVIFIVCTYVVFLSSFRIVAVFCEAHKFKISLVTAVSCEDCGALAGRGFKR